MNDLLNIDRLQHRKIHLNKDWNGSTRFQHTNQYLDITVPSHHKYHVRSGLVHAPETWRTNNKIES